jgi:hypothetical protein
MYVLILVSIALSVHFFRSDVFLYTLMVSASLFFFFMSKNPKLLLVDNVKGIDELIPGLERVDALYGAILSFIVGLFFM